MLSMPHLECHAAHAAHMERSTRMGGLCALWISVAAGVASATWAQSTSAAKAPKRGQGAEGQGADDLRQGGEA